MNTQAATKPTLYEDLIDLPASLTGEILDGQLYAHPRPGGKHVLAASNIGMEIGSAYHRGRGGPGGWWILVEPEVHFSLDQELTVPDVAGWLKSRMPVIPDSHKFTTVPDWICEVLSPSTESIDREIKMPLYARHGVKYLWLLHPVKQELIAYKLNEDRWVMIGEFTSGDNLSVEPFLALKLTLKELME